MVLQKTKYCKLYILLSVISYIAILSSCVKDDVSDCRIDIRFRYIYNIKSSNAFGNEAQNVVVWIFDNNGMFLSQYSDNIDNQNNDYSMHIPTLPIGKYTFVAWAKSTKERDLQSNFDISALKKGDNINALYSKIQRINNECKTKLNSTLCGNISTTISGERQTITIDMMKVTHTLRFLLMPTTANISLNSNDYDFRIHDKNGWLAYDGSLYKEDALDYTPYYQERIQSSNNNTDEINNAVVAELNTSRLLYNQEPRLVILNKKTGTQLININLTWFLALQGIGEHKAEWSDQEYLDRQDYYAITLFIDGHTWMMNKIIVNGWVLSLTDTNLE